MSQDILVQMLLHRMCLSQELQQDGCKVGNISSKGSRSSAAFSQVSIDLSSLQDQTCPLSFLQTHFLVRRKVPSAVGWVSLRGPSSCPCDLAGLGTVSVSGLWTHPHLKLGSFQTLDGLFEPGMLLLQSPWDMKSVVPKPSPSSTV